jgi:ATP/ADP translocase
MSIEKAVAPNVILIGVKLFFARILFPTNLYNKFLARQVESVDKEARPAYMETFIECIKLTKSNSKKYSTHDSETGHICNTYLVFKHYYPYVYRHVKNNRIKWGL